jgi:hypothetical protein
MFLHGLPSRYNSTTTETGCPPELREKRARFTGRRVPRAVPFKNEAKKA